MQDLGDRPIHWWVNKLWKIKGPLKGILFFWLVLKGKVLTWDRMQLRNKHSLGLCYLCSRSHDETNIHLFMECPFFMPGLEGNRFSVGIRSIMGQGLYL
jgi:hypothetical protein